MSQSNDKYKLECSILSCNHQGDRSRDLILGISIDYHSKYIDFLEIEPGNTIKLDSKILSELKSLWLFKDDFKNIFLIEFNYNLIQNLTINQIDSDILTNCTEDIEIYFNKLLDEYKIKIKTYPAKYLHQLIYKILVDLLRTNYLSQPTDQYQLECTYLSHDHQGKDDHIVNILIY